MRLVVLVEDTPVSEVVCQDEAVYLGSRDTCSVHLPDERIPGQLAVIYPEGKDVWILEPLAEKAGLQLNGAAVTEKVMLKSGDRLTVQEFVIRAFLDELGGPAPPKLAGRTSVANMARFVRFQLPPGSTIKKPDEPLEVQQSHLGRIGRINVALGQCEAVEGLMDLALQNLLEMFAAQRAWIGVRRVNYGPMEYVEGRMITGQTAELTETGDNLKPRVLDRGQFVLIPSLSPEQPLSILTGPLLGPDGTLGLVYLDSGDTARRFDIHDLDYFILALNLFAAQLDAIFKNIAKARAAILEGEVSVAHAIQARLTPRMLPQWDELNFGAFREPGRQRTSDMYDVVRLATQKAGFMIGHTNATGPLPGMVMSQAQAAFRFAVMHGHAPNLFLKSLNILLYDGQSDRLLDCLMGVLDPSSGELRYAMAGSIGAFIVDNRGEERRLTPPETTPALGSLKVASYPLLNEEIESGETLVLFTPGVVTARNSREEVFGEERFVNILCDGFGQPASTMLKEMLQDLRNFTEAGSQPDDITVILAHRL